MNAVDEGRCAASSAKGLSSMCICSCWIGIDWPLALEPCDIVLCEGMSTNPGIAENTCVMPRDASVERFSASARSERYRRGMISDGLVAGVRGCE